jgi:hypothetical protein
VQTLPDLRRLFGHWLPQLAPPGPENHLLFEYSNRIPIGSVAHLLVPTAPKMITSRSPMPRLDGLGMRARDSLHAIQWQHVHGSASVQVTVSGRPHQSPGIQVGCCTFVLYGPGHPHCELSGTDSRYGTRLTQHQIISASPPGACLASTSLIMPDSGCWRTSLTPASRCRVHRRCARVPRPGNRPYPMLELAGHPSSPRWHTAGPRPCTPAPGIPQPVPRGATKRSR